MPRFLFIIIGLLILSACNTSTNKRVLITIHAPQSKNVHAQIHLVPMLELMPEILAQVELDSLGEGELNLELDKPTFAILVIGERYTDVYLNPGNSLIVDAPLDKAFPLLYKGSGAEVNNYLAGATSLLYRTEQANGVGGRQMIDPAAYQIYLQQAIDTLKHFHVSYTDTISLPAEEDLLMRKRNAVTLLMGKSSYEYVYPLINPASDLSRVNDLKIPDMPAGKIFPFDSLLINRNLGALSMSYHYLVLNNYFNPIGRDSATQRDEHLKAQVPLRILEQIKRDQLEPVVTEILLAKNVDISLEAYGKTPEVDSVLHEFDRMYPGSVWRPAIQKRYVKWEVLEPGKPAPDFSGITPTGDTVSLSDLRGKILYVDVWATWCGPCVAEIPASKVLRKKFTNTDKLVFLNLSIDTDREAWQKKLRNEQDWKDVHLVAIDQEFQTKYQLKGVPRYVLIGADGRIIRAEAPRPSDTVLEQLLAGLIKTQ